MAAVVGMSLRDVRSTILLLKGFPRSALEDPGSTWVPGSRRPVNPPVSRPGVRLESVTPPSGALRSRSNTLLDGTRLFSPGFVGEVSPRFEESVSPRSEPGRSFCVGESLRSGTRLTSPGLLPPVSREVPPGIVSPRFPSGIRPTSPGLRSPVLRDVESGVRSRSELGGRLTTPPERSSPRCGGRVTPPDRSSLPLPGAPRPTFPEDGGVSLPLWGDLGVSMRPEPSLREGDVTTRSPPRGAAGAEARSRTTGGALGRDDTRGSDCVITWGLLGRETRGGALTRGELGMLTRGELGAVIRGALLGALAWERAGLETRAPPPDAAERPLEEPEERSGSAITLLTIRADPNRIGAIRSIRLNFNMALIPSFRIFDLTTPGSIVPRKVTLRKTDWFSATRVTRETHPDSAPPGRVFEAKPWRASSGSLFLNTSDTRLKEMFREKKRGKKKDA